MSDPAAPLPGNVETITLGQQGIETSNFDRYKGVAGKTDRLMLMGPLIRAYSFYVQQGQSGKRFIAPSAKDHPDLLALCKKQLGEPNQYFAIVVFHYNTDGDGAFIPGTEGKCSGKIKLWRWSETKYEEYSALNKQWPIIDVDKIGQAVTKQHDLMVKTTEERYQRMTTNPAPECHVKSKQGWYDKLKERANQAAPKLIQTIGLQLSPQEITELLGAPTAGAAPPTQSSAGDVDLSDVLDEVD